MRKVVCCLLVLVAAVLATSVTPSTIGAPAAPDPVHPDDTPYKLMTLLAEKAKLDPMTVELIFCVKRTSMAAVEQGWAVAIFDPAKGIAVAGLFNADLKLAEISYRYQAVEKTSKLILAAAAHHEGPFAAQTGTPGPAMVIGVSYPTRGTCSVSCLTGWDGPNNRWAKVDVKGLKTADFK